MAKKKKKKKVLKYIVNKYSIYIHNKKKKKIYIYIYILTSVKKSTLVLDDFVLESNLT